ncbi:hypothetical protein [Shewanella woodyi]|uniref:hypothetical protein n=1 Tax=Shewanella woodyi TaxID=60961 RepID=UPI0007E989FE|nr:hypothetical protein [Shewanella woodyi]
MEKSMFSRLAFWRKSSVKRRLGVYVCPEKVVVYHLNDENQQSDVASNNSKEFPFDGVNWNRLFAELGKEFGPAQLQVTLSSPYYQLLLVDKPNVDPEEMTQALLWSVKDMISQPVTDIHLDYFESPQQNSAKLSVVIVDRQKITALILAAKEQEMQLAGITIEEMAISNLFWQEPQAKLVISHQPGQEILLTVIRQGDLYMQRRVRGFNQIDTASAEELGFGMADNLSLELQRSMDYFESQLRQAPVSSIELLINGQTERLAELVSVNFNQEVNAIAAEGVESIMAKLALTELERDEVELVEAQT